MVVSKLHFFLTGLKGYRFIERFRDVNNEIAKNVNTSVTLVTSLVFTVSRVRW